MNKIKKIGFITFLISLFNCVCIFAASSTKNTAATTTTNNVKDVVSKVIDPNILGESYIPGLLNGQVLYYFIIPMIIFLLLLVVINNIILKKNIDTPMILVGIGASIAIQFFLLNPLNDLIVTNQTVVEQLTGGIRSFFAGLFGGETAVDVTNNLSLIYAIAMDVVLGFVGLVVHNLFIDHRAADKSQGIKVVLGQLLACGVVIALFAFGVI